MAGTFVANISHGAGPTVASAESGIGFGLADGVDVAASNPVTKPAATGTAYSWYKALSLHCTSDGDGTTSVSDISISLASAATTGLFAFFQDGGATYTQASGANKPTDDAVSNGAVPAGYTAMTTTPAVYHAGPVAAADATRMGDYLLVVAGVGNNYAGGAGDIALPNLSVMFTESPT